MMSDELAKLTVGNFFSDDTASVAKSIILLIHADLWF